MKSCHLANCQTIMKRLTFSKPVEEVKDRQTWPNGPKPIGGRIQTHTCRAQEPKASTQATQATPSLLFLDLRIRVPSQADSNVLRPSQLGESKPQETESSEPVAVRSESARPSNVISLCYLDSARIHLQSFTKRIVCWLVRRSDCDYSTIMRSHNDAQRHHWFRSAGRVANAVSDEVKHLTSHGSNVSVTAASPYPLVATRGSWHRY